MATPAPSTLPTAEELSNEFKEFAYSVSHDLGAPLRAVVEFSRLLSEEQREGLSEDAQLYLSLIIENGTKLQSMLGGLLEYSRLNTLAKTLSNVDCQLVLEHCQLVLKDKIEKSGAQLHVGKLPHVCSDPEQLMQLFLYLLDNALTYHAAGVAPVIEVSAEQIDGHWRLCIRDQGIGIDPRFYEQIFKPFHRLHSDEEYPGIGMGLALAKKIVTRHQGNIGVESSGEGTYFFFTLPAGE